MKGPGYRIYWQAEYIANEYEVGIPPGGATRFLYTSAAAPVEANEYDRVCNELEHKALSLVQAYKENAKLRFYIAEIEKHLSKDEIERASERASELARQQEVQP